MSTTLFSLRAGRWLESTSLLHAAAMCWLSLSAALRYGDSSGLKGVRQAVRRNNRLTSVTTFDPLDFLSTTGVGFNRDAFVFLQVRPAIGDGKFRARLNEQSPQRSGLVFVSRAAVEAIPRIEQRWTRTSSMSPQSHSCCTSRPDTIGGVANVERTVPKDVGCIELTVHIEPRSPHSR